MRLRGAFAVAVLTGSVAVFGGCGSDAESPADPKPSRTHPSSGKSWTLMVYMLADNDLEPYALKDLTEMMKVGSRDNFTVLVQADRAVGEAENSIGGLANWTGTKRLRVEQGQLVELQDLGEQNMGDPAVLADFIGWAAHTAPADRYGIVLWDHGGAWPAYGVDWSAERDHLTMPELAKAFETGMAAAGIGQFSFIGFDACLMATYETASTLGPYGEYLIASEEVEPGDGWDYGAFAVAADDPGTSPVDLGKAVIDGFQAQAEWSGQGATVTLSLVDLYALELLQKAVDSLSGNLGGANLARIARQVGATREATQKFGENPDPTRSTQMIDLGDFARQLSGAASTGDVLKYLGRTVLASMNGDARPNATGLSIYFPPDPSLYLAAYDEVPRIDGWRSFLKSYLGRGAALGTGPRFTNPEHAGELSVNGDGTLTLRGTLAAGTFDNVTDVTTLYGLQLDNGDLAFLGDQPGELDGGGTASGSWAPAVLTASQRGQSDTAYLNLTVAGEGIISATVPFLYTTGTRQEIVVYVVAFDVEGNELSRGFYAESNGAWGELVPDDGSKVQTLVQLLASGASEATWALVEGAEFDPGVPIDLSTDALQSGSPVFMLLTATDFGGNSDYVIAGGRLP